MTQHHPIALAIALAFATSAALSGCDRITGLTEQEHIQRAKDFEDEGNLKGSIVELKNAIQQNPDSPQARLLLGQIYLKAGMGAEAEKELTRAKKLGVNSESINPHLGEALLLMGEYKRVLDEIHPGERTSNVNLAHIMQLRADALLMQGKLKDACNLYQQSLDIDTNNPPTYWGMAQCAAAERNITKAREWLDAALKIGDRQAKTWVYIAGVEQLDNNVEGTLVAYSNALKLEPENLDALLSRATINTRLGRMEPARIDIEKIRKLAPKSLGANYLQALFKFRENKFSEARVALQETLKIDPNYLPALLLGGSIELALNNLQIAEAHIQKVLRATPRNSNALKMLTVIQLRQGRTDEAEKTIAPIIDLGRTKDAGIHAIAGEIALEKKEFAKASGYFEKAAELSPENAAIRTELGISRLAQGDARAIADLQAAADIGDPVNRVDSIIILTRLRQKQFDEALISIAELEKKQPQSPHVWNYRGAAYQGKKDNSKARDSFNAALKLDPAFFPAAVNLAQLDLAEGKPAQARKRFEGVLKASPKHLPSMLALADLSMQAKDEKAYIRWLEDASEAHPQAISPRSALAHFYLAKKEPSKALALAKETVNANPDNSEALNFLGSIQLATGDRTNAIATFTKLTKKASQSPEAYLRLALVQIADKKMAAAQTTLQEALRLQPNHLQCLDVMLRLKLAEKKPEDAMQVARQIQAHHPKLPIGFDREADILAAQKRWPQAIQSYEQALDRGAGSAGFLKLFRVQLMTGESKHAEQRIINWLKLHPKDNVVRAHAAEYYLVNGRNKDAIAHYQELQRQEPNNIIVLNNLANLYHREKDKRALATAEQALKLAPENPVVQDTLGWILVEQGQAPRGLELLRKALAKAPKAADVRYHHAVALARTGKKIVAREELEKLLRDVPKFPEADAARAILKTL